MTVDFEERAKQYLILVEGGPPSNYSAWSPDLPGCVGVGDTVEECVEDMLQAIAFHLQGIAADDQPLPDATGPGVYLELTPPAAA